LALLEGFTWPASTPAIAQRWARWLLEQRGIVCLKTALEQPWRDLVPA
jgi:hypothetical protein